MMPDTMTSSRRTATAAATPRGKRSRISNSTTGARMNASSTDTSITARTSSAQELEAIRRQNKRLDFEQLDRVIREYQVTEIVVGLPLRMSGAEGIQAEKMQGFAEQLRQRFQGPVHLWDERLSSAQANRVLRDSEMSIKRRGEVVDRLAAVLILQSWMDHRDLQHQHD